MFRSLFTRNRRRGSWLTRIIGNWWRLKMYWRVGQTLVNAVRQLRGRRTRPTTLYR